MSSDYAEDRPDWQQFGRCRGTAPGLFFPEFDDAATATKAKAVCNGADGAGPCPVRGPCLEWALVNTIREGIWGGLGEGTRRRLRRQRAESA